jgi:AcrR family transcriptional regulator
MKENKKVGRSKSRARSPEKRAKQLKRIIDTGRELFITRGANKFKMRDLAEMLEMYQGNLYNYVNSKENYFLQSLQATTKDLEKI